MDTNGVPRRDRRKCPETRAPLYDPALRHSFLTSSQQTPEQRELMLRGWRDRGVIDNAEFEFYTRNHPPCDVEPVT